MTDIPLQREAVALFSEVSDPIINGVVASIEGLRAGLAAAAIDATIVAPYFPHARDRGDAIVRLASLPLPSSSGYRLCIPRIARGVRARIANASIVHVHSPFVTGWLGMDFARRSCVPLVFTYHTRIEDYAHYVPLEPHLARAAMIALTRAFANRTDAVIAPTSAMRDRLREIGVRVPIAVVPSSIDVAHFASGVRDRATRALLGARDDRPIALCVARVVKEKHLELAIDALAHAPRMQLAIVGDGPHRSALEARATRAGVRERVTFAGAVAPDALPAIYAASDVFAFTSETETQGLVLAEALAAGLPVVAVDTPVTREVLAGSGRLTAPDPVAFGAAVEAAAGLGRDPGAADAVRRRFGREARTADVIEVYRSISVCRTFGTPMRDHAPG